MSGDLEDFTCALAAADVVWSRELGDPPSEPAYIEALARNVWELWVEPHLERLTRELAEVREFGNDAMTRSSEQAQELGKWVEGYGKLSADNKRLTRERDEAKAKLEQSHEINDGWVRYGERVKGQKREWRQKVTELEAQLASRPAIPADAIEQLDYRLRRMSWNEVDRSCVKLHVQQILGIGLYAHSAPSVCADTTAANVLDDGIGELMCRDCGHPENPFSSDTSWMCVRHRPVSSGGDTDTTEVPGE